MMAWLALENTNLSPLQELQDARLQSAQLQLWIKRDDLLAIRPNDPFSGNKWRKLKYNLLAARAKQLPLLSFGGVHSNHIAALASAGQQFGLATIGIIRGEAMDTPTLQLAQEAGMELYFINRSDYRQKLVPQAIGPHLLIPEGGSNDLALQGCAKLVDELRSQWSEGWPDYISLPMGTGGTMAGIIKGLNGASKVLGFASLKGDFLAKEVKQLLGTATFDNWEVQNDYHFGGYARWQPDLIDFILDFHQQHQIILDPIYGGKHLFGLFDLIAKGYFPPGSQLLAIHTGGLQGIKGFNQRFGLALPTA